MKIRALGRDGMTAIDTEDAVFLDSAVGIGAVPMRLVMSSLGK